MRKGSTPGTVGTTDIIVSDPDDNNDDTMQCSTPKMSDDDSELANVLNCDLVMNKLSTSDTATKIWSNLNMRCIKRFGSNDHIKNDISISDVTWACTTLPAYRSWNTMKEYYNDIDGWLTKIKEFGRLNL